MALIRRALPGVLAALLLAGCASRTSAVSAPLLLQARELVYQGCYDCLLEARETYEQAADTGRRDAVLRLLEVDLLLALRDKELARDPSEALRRARSSIRRLSDDTAAARYVELVEAVPPDDAGTPKRLRGEYLTTMLRPQFRPRELGWVRQGISDGAGAPAMDPVVREYIALAVECERTIVSERNVPDVSLQAPLLAFRLAICPATPDIDALHALRKDVAAFVEIGLFLARGTLIARDGDEAASATAANAANTRAWLEDAAERFPDSAAITFELGIVAQIQGDLRRAADRYGDTLALAPDHEDARLGRATALTYLNAPGDAIADATVLIDSGAYNRGEGYYWRAFNRHRAARERRDGGSTGRDLEWARDDIEQAKALVSSSRVLTLAGMIEHDQGDLGTATADLVLAAQLDASNCAARWYLGVVRHAGERWGDSGAAFADAARCYDGSASRTEQSRAALAVRTDVDEEFRARQLAGFEAAIRDDRTQESASALNAAIGYARAGDRETAERFLDQAAKDPAHRMTAEDLRQVMRGPQ